VNAKLNWTFQESEDPTHDFDLKVKLSPTTPNVPVASPFPNLAEKPKMLNETLDNFAITGCYRFDRRFFSFFKGLKPSARGEFEIVDIIEAYHRIGELAPTFTKPGSLWSDAGTHETINFLNDHFYHQQKEKSE
jgi:dTDP-glucose pyrophosphorylase